ncbi:MAG: 50S ribosomal protein L24 [Kiritimatiellaeota bacterium]|nr:50S ribosomal protein L24 [Kiritimatiellota bacterium]
MTKPKFHVKKGDTVRVLTGDYKGKEGTVVTVLPAKMRVVLSGIESGKKRAVKPSQNKPGGMVDRAVSTHISNVRKIEKKTESPKKETKKSDKK